MKKTMGKRILGSVTALLLATMSLSNTSFGPFNLGGEKALVAEAASGFTATPEQLGWMNANNLGASVLFENALGAQLETTILENTYYLLVHASRAESQTMWGTTSAIDSYKLFEVSASGDTSWHTGAFTFDGVDPMNAWGISLDGVFLKNADASADLTLDNAKSRTGCAETERIEGFSLNGGEIENFNSFTFHAQGGHGVVINTYNYDGVEPKTVEIADGTNFVVLSYLTPKGTGNDRSKVVGWAIEPFDPTKNTTSQLAFMDYYPYGEDGSDTTAAKFTYDPDKYDVNERVFQSTEALNTFKDCFENGSDTIPGYRFEYSQIDGLTTLSIIRDNATYDLTIDFDQPATFTEDDHVYLVVTVDHATTDHTYYGIPLVVNNQKEFKVNIQDKDTAKWMNSNGGELPKERISGQEFIEAALVMSKEKLGYNTLFAGSASSPIQDGEVVKGYAVKYDNLEATPDTANHLTAYLQKIHLTKVNASNDYDFRKILGGALNYGITADRFEQKNHAQTNLAVNFYQGHNTPIESDLAAPNGGEFYLPWFVDFEDGTTVDASTKRLDPSTDMGRINLGQSHSGELTIHADSENRVSEKNTHLKKYGQNGFASVVEEDPATMSSTIIEPAINHMEEKDNGTD